MATTTRRRPRVQRYGGAGRNTRRYVSKAGGTRGEFRGVRRNLRRGGASRTRQLKTLRKTYASEFGKGSKRYGRAMTSARRVGTKRVGGQTFTNRKLRTSAGKSRKQFNRSTRRYIRNNLQGRPGKVNAFRRRRSTLYRASHFR